MTAMLAWLPLSPLRPWAMSSKRNGSAAPMMFLLDSTTLLQSHQGSPGVGKIEIHQTSQQMACPGCSRQLQRTDHALQADRLGKVTDRPVQPAHNVLDPPTHVQRRP